MRQVYSVFPALFCFGLGLVSIVVYSFYHNIWFAVCGLASLFIGVVYFYSVLWLDV